MKQATMNLIERCRRSYPLAYTLAFVLTALVVLFVFPSNGRSILWNVDGIEQYYPFFIYEGQWIRDVVGSLLAGSFAIPMWEPNLGYGADVLTTLDVFFDPLNALSALCPERFSEYAFQFVLVLRLYLAGAAFSLFALRMGCGRYATLLAAMLYAFCGTAAGSLQWPGFGWALILFPLLLFAIEKMLAGERPYLFVIAIALYFGISCYFAYGACIFMLFYCAVRVIQTQQPMSVATFLDWVGKFAGLLVIGVLLAGLALIPSALGIFGGDRATSVRAVVPLLYDIHFYQEAIAGFISTTGMGSDCFIGYGGLAVLACAALFARKKENLPLKICFVVMTIGLLLPIVGSVFNGFNYATNRWIWAYALLVCYIVAKMLPDLLNATPRLIRILLGTSLVYLVLVLLLPESRTEKTLAAFVLLGAFLVIICLTGIKRETRRCAMAVCLVGALSVNMFYMMAPDEGGWGGTYTPLTTAYYKLTDRSPNKLVAALEADDANSYRYDASAAVKNTDRTRNDSLILGLSGIDFYNSLYNNDIDAYHTQLGVVGTSINFSYQTLGDRSTLDTLNSVKYFLDPTGYPAPYNYDRTVAAQGEARGVNYTIYQGTRTLPYVYTYHAQVSEQAWDAMTPIQRQQALLQGAVLYGEDEQSATSSTDAASTGSSATGSASTNSSATAASTNAVPTITPTFTNQELPYTITAADGVTVGENAFLATKANATVTLTFEGLANADTYLEVSNLTYTALSPIGLMGEAQFNALPLLEKANTLKQDLSWKEPQTFAVTATSSIGTSSKLESPIASSHMYGGKSNWLYSLGYSTEPQTSITLTFGGSGAYTFDKLSVQALPMDTFDSQVQALEPANLQGGSFTTNAFSCSLSTEQGDVVYFSIPYAEGWSATVDGQPAQLIRANTAFMALVLEPGTHSIQLSYSTPCLPLAATCTGVGFVAFAVLIALVEVARRRK